MALIERLVALRRYYGDPSSHGNTPDRLWERFAAILDERGVDPDAITAAAGPEPILPDSSVPFGSPLHAAAIATRRAWRDALSAARQPVREAFSAAMRELYEEPLWGDIPHGPPSFPEPNPYSIATFAWVEIGGKRISVGDVFAERRRDRTLRISGIQARAWGKVLLSAKVLGEHQRGTQDYSMMRPETLLSGYRRVETPDRKEPQA